MSWISRLFGKNKGRGSSQHDFKIGDKVICIDDRGGDGIPPVIYKKVYTILDIAYCNKCGSRAIDVGFKSYRDGYTRCDEDRCGTFVGKGIHWAGDFRFAPYQSQSKKNENTESMVKLEPKKIIKELEIHSN